MPLLAELRARLPVASSFEGVVLLSGDSTRALLACTVAGLPKELLLLVIVERPAMTMQPQQADDATALCQRIAPPPPTGPATLGD